MEDGMRLILIVLAISLASCRPEPLGLANITPPPSAEYTADLKTRAAAEDARLRRMIADAMLNGHLIGILEGCAAPYVSTQSLKRGWQSAWERRDHVIASELYQTLLDASVDGFRAARKSPTVACRTRDQDLEKARYLLSFYIRTGT